MALEQQQPDDFLARQAAAEEAMLAELQRVREVGTEADLAFLAAHGITTRTAAQEQLADHEA